MPDWMIWVFVAIGVIVTIGLFVISYMDSKIKKIKRRKIKRFWIVEAEEG